MSIFEQFTERKPRPLPVLVLADTSGSMTQDNKIGVLNRSMREMVSALAQEDDVAGEIQLGVITFGGDAAEMHQPLMAVSDVDFKDLPAGGRTPMGSAFELAATIVDDTDRVPHRAYQPTIVLVSDGRPTDDWRSGLERLLGSTRAFRAMRFAVGVGVDVDEEAEAVLRTFVGEQTHGLIRADEVEILPKFFRWVTMSVTTRLKSATPDSFPAVTINDLDH
jgi:uncharacterized protein YegL